MTPYRFMVVNAEQRSPEWFAARLGRLTGSVAGKILAKGRTKGEESTQRRNLRIQLVLERLTCAVVEDEPYVSPAMLAGIDREAMAFRAYEAVTGDLVQRSGFLSMVDHMAGCSLDGHLGDFDKLLSIKCRQPAAHYEFLRSGKIPADALAQMRHEMWVTGALEHDYFSFNPDFPDDLQSRTVTLTREQADIPAYEAAALAFLREVDTEEDAIRTMRDLGAVLQEAV